MESPRTLRELRTEQRLRLTDVAERAHLHLNTVWRIEQGRTRPFPSTRYLLAQALNTRPDQINWRPPAA
jgi:transcriptional regulator with XRE-family HTH domain